MWEIFKNTMPFLAEGLWVTVKLSFTTILFGSTLGFFIGIGRVIGFRPLNAALAIYIHLLRGTPFLVQLYIVYFVLPTTGIAWLKLESYTAAVLALGIYTSSYIAEIVRAAIKAIPRGQLEASRACGMSWTQAMRHVILPQAYRLMIPPMAGIYVIIIKSTAILSVIGINELVRQADNAILRHPAQILFIYFIVAGLYFLYCYPVLRFARYAESRWGGVKVEDA